MDLDETWQLGLKYEKAKPCTFPAKSCYGFRREREKMGRKGVFLWREPLTTSATFSFLGSISAKLPTNTCPGGVSRHMVSHSRKVSIKGSNFPKKPLFRVPFVLSLQVRGNVLRCLQSFHPLVDIPQMYFSLGDFCWGMYHFPAIHLESLPLPQYQQWAYLDGETVVTPGERRHTNQ